MLILSYRKMLGGKISIRELYLADFGLVVNQFGVASVSYRRPSMPSRKPDEYDNAVVRVRGVDICLAWRRFGGGGDGCYPVSEETAGRYRLSTGPLWCDISPK